MYSKKIEDIFLLLRLTNKSVSNNQSLYIFITKRLNSHYLQAIL